MQSMLHLSATYGLPLTVYGINQHLCSLSKRIADHDCRSQSMKRQRSLARENLHEIEAEGTFERVLKEIIEGEIDENLASELQDLFLNCLDLNCHV